MVRVTAGPILNRPPNVPASIEVVWSASTTNRLTVIGLARRADGQVSTFRGTEAHAGDRTTETVEIVGDVPGDVVALTISIASGVSRGQAYVQANLVMFGASHALCAGYVYDGFALTLGTFVEPGATAVYSENVTIANEAAAGAGIIGRLYQPASDTTLRLLFGIIQNDNTSAVRALAQIDNGTDNQDMTFIGDDFSLAAAAIMSFPNQPFFAGGSTVEAITTVGPFFLAGSQRLMLRSITPADGQDATFAVTFLVHGILPAAPTRTSQGAGTEVVTVNSSTLTFLPLGGP